MAQDLAQPAGGEVPAIARPHLLGLVALHQLPDHRLDPAAFLRQLARPGLLLSLLELVGCQQVQPLLVEPLGKPWDPVIPVT